MKNLIMGMLLTALPLSAFAVNITVTQSAGCVAGLGGGAPAIAACNGLVSEINTLVSADTPDVNIDKYAAGMANANAFAMKGQGSDYAENFTHFVFKPSFGVALDGDMDKPENANGIGLGGALTVGLNLDMLPFDKIGSVEMKDLDIFISFMNYDIDESQDDTSFAGELSSFGIFARYRFMEGKDIFPGYMLEWGGIHLHTGLQRSTMGIKLTQSFKDQTVTSGSTTGTFGDSSAVFNIDTTTTSIPLEISTYMRMLYVFTLYTGLGLDYNIGDGEVGLNASGSVSSSGTEVATISANETGTGDAQATNFRGFLGLQFNVPLVRLYVHVNKGLGNDLFGANFGAKITY
jgi:hypothetical protein